jgi:hypothetical protein
VQVQVHGGYRLQAGCGHIDIGCIVATIYARRSGAQLQVVVQCAGRVVRTISIDEERITVDIPGAGKASLNVAVGHARDDAGAGVYLRWCAAGGRVVPEDTVADANSRCGTVRITTNGAAARAGATGGGVSHEGAVRYR